MKKVYFLLVVGLVAAAIVVGVLLSAYLNYNNPVNVLDRKVQSYEPTTTLLTYDRMTNQTFMANKELADGKFTEVSESSFLGALQQNLNDKEDVLVVRVNNSFYLVVYTKTYVCCAP